jgi:hypothetical protein
MAVPSSALERSTPALALMKPWCVSVMQNATRLAFDDGDFVLVGPVERHDLTFRLGDHLAGHDYEVVFAQRFARGRQRIDEKRYEVVATSDHDRASQRDESKFAHEINTVASRRALSGSAMIVVVTSTRIPR